MRRVRAAWDRFFFEPIRPATLGLFRIAFGLVTLLSLIGKLPDRALFYGEHGLVTARTSAVYFQSAPLGRFLLERVPAGDPALLVFFVGLIALALCVTLGVLPRASSILLFLGLVALSNRDFAADNAGDDLLRLDSFFLMFAPAGAAYSLEGWWRGRRGGRPGEPPLVSPWALRLLQLQLAYVYVDTVFLKLHGRAWLDGTAIYYALHYVELRRFSLDWLFRSLWQVRLATWAVLATELAMGTLVWWRRLRYPCLGAALILHTGLGFAFQFPVFEYAMIAGLLLFVAPEDTERVLARLHAVLRGAAGSPVRPSPSKTS